MKKIVAYVLLVSLLLSMAACAKPEGTAQLAVTEPTEAAEETEPAETAEETEATEAAEETENPYELALLAQDERNAIEAGKLIFPEPIDTASLMKVNTSCVKTLAQMLHEQKAAAAAGIKPYDQLYYHRDIPMDADLSASLPLCYTLTFSDKTKFSGKMPASFDPEALLEWGKAPGLGVDILHEMGYTGKGAVIAYIDQPIHGHPEYSNTVNLHYANNSGAYGSMHGPSVLSLLAGKDIGVAPDAEVYFYAHAAWEEDQTTHAQCLYQIIEQNMSLPDENKITMVGFSDNIDPTEANADAFRKAVKACEEAGVMVFFCGDYSAAAFLPFGNKDDFENLAKDNWERGKSGIFVPTSGRTTAWGEDDIQYIYWGNGGLSWAMPYVLGVYAIAKSIDPSLTKAELQTILAETATKNSTGIKIINPVAYIAKVLGMVGRQEEMEKLQALAQKPYENCEYYYALLNTQKMSKQDLLAVETYLSTVTDAYVLVVDTAGLKDAKAVYSVLQADSYKRGGSVKGIQIFGDADSVPSFKITYKVRMGNGEIDNGGQILSDLFYGNLNNHAIDLKQSYNVMEHFETGAHIQFTPEWPVVRLPLRSGQYQKFMVKYENFRITQQETIPIVNLSSPIFETRIHLDDMGTFLNRMDNTFRLLDIPYRLYGNQDGDYPVETAVEGNYNRENLTKENENGVAEFIINSHGQQNNIDQVYFENGEEVRASLVNAKNINEVLSSNPYYLDTWTCNNGYGMKNNLTTTALNGQCVGMFSATTIISNNGVDNGGSIQSLAESNFYYFYLEYLYALSQGESRAEAFYSAQKNYSNALIVHSRKGIGLEGNYQFNLYNLFGYHNFGLIQ